MPKPTTTQMLHFLGSQRSFIHERRDFVCDVFASLRSNLFKFIIGITDSGEHDDLAIASRLRGTFSEWLTMPIMFDGSLANQLAELGDSAEVGGRWGDGMRIHFELALAKANELKEQRNPICEGLLQAVTESCNSGKKLRIYCSRPAKLHFLNALSCVEMPLDEENVFLCSGADYRNACLFDTLVMVGPLRLRGWGCAPAAIKTAPKFSHLLQLVWSGLADKDDFASDPLSSVFGENIIGHRIKWDTHVVVIGRSEEVAVPSEDELSFFEQAIDQTPEQTRRCALLGLSDNLAVAYAISSTVLIFDPTDVSINAVSERHAEEVRDGVYLIRYVLSEDIDLGGGACNHGQLSLTWKKRLSDARERNHKLLVEQLRAEGLKLEHLSTALRNWCKPAGAVIPAPQQMKHFRILMRVLGLEGVIQEGAREFWQLAWKEISRSRGDASEAGRQREDIVAAELLSAAREIEPQIRQASDGVCDFSLQIPAGRGLSGQFLLSRVLVADDSFLVPQQLIGKIAPDSDFEQWRV